MADDSFTHTRPRAGQRLSRLVGLVFMLTGLSGELRAEDPVSFQHPGLLHTQEEIAFVRGKISRGEEPWKSAWEDLRDWRGASLRVRPESRAKIVRGPYSRPDHGSSEFSRDGAIAYTHALQWCLTGNEAHAKKTVEILNAWSSTLETVEGHDAKLLIGMAGVFYCNAAELIRHAKVRPVFNEWSIWKEKDQKQFEKMLREVFYPTIGDFYPTANGNWDAAMMQTMLAMAIYLDDRKMFDRVVKYVRSADTNGAIEMYIKASGQTQESGRDQYHTQMGIGYLSVLCEMAWKQKVDLYSIADNRLAKGFEYTAEYNLGGKVDYVPFVSLEGRYNYEKISDRGRGRFRPIYEIIYHHYHRRAGLEMPFTRKVVEEQSPEEFSKQHIPWGTLMFHGQPTGKPATR